MYYGYHFVYLVLFQFIFCEIFETICLNIKKKIFESLLKLFLKNTSLIISLVVLFIINPRKSLQILKFYLLRFLFSTNSENNGESTSFPFNNTRAVRYTKIYSIFFASLPSFFGEKYFFTESDHATKS